MPKSAASDNPIRSMTGFARVRRPLGDGEVVVSVKAVNHRGLDLHLHLPTVADVFDNAIRKMVKQQVRRGHVDIRLVLPDSLRNPSAGAINRKLVAEFLAAFHEVSKEHGLDAAPDLNTLVRLPGMLGESDNGDLPEETEAVVLDALAEALRELNAFRAREGGEIVEVMREFNRQIADAVRAD